MQQQMRELDDLQPGHALPNSDGTVSDEDVNAIDGRAEEGGKDHSLDDYADRDPDHGVGNVQDRSDTGSDVARIRSSE